VSGAQFILERELSDSLAFVMIDIHHHLLAGLDDGASDLETSVAMAKLAVADGITHVVCTPHANGRYSYDRARNRDRIAELQEELAREDVALTLGLGCDFHVSYDNIQDALVAPGQFTINETCYLLIELPDYGIPPAITETFRELQRGGLRLILTHPERNPTLVANPARMMEWLRHGMLVQVTADSVTGRMGKVAQKMAHDLLGKRSVHFVASDAHNASSRPPRMKEARDVIGQRYGAEYAEALCVKNPGAVFLGEELAGLTEPPGVAEEPRAKGWFSRLMGR
jgi:protein-tyrosine phosphatase